MIVFAFLISTLLILLTVVPQGLFGALCARYSRHFHTDETGMPTA